MKRNARPKVERKGRSPGEVDGEGGEAEIQAQRRIKNSWKNLLHNRNRTLSDASTGNCASTEVPDIRCKSKRTTETYNFKATLLQTPDRIAIASETGKARNKAWIFRCRTGDSFKGPFSVVSDGQRVIQFEWNRNSKFKSISMGIMNISLCFKQILAPPNTRENELKENGKRK